MNPSLNQQPPPSNTMPLDWLLVNLPNGMCMTFIGKRRDLDPETVELCAPDGRPIMQIPRRYVTSTTKEETARLILEEARRRRAEAN